MNKIICKLANKKAEMYISKVVWVLAVIIVGMFLMWGVYEIFQQTVLPGLDAQINDIFANGDAAIDSANRAGDYTSDGYGAAAGTTTPNP